MSRVLPGVCALAIGEPASAGPETGIARSTGAVSFANMRVADEAAADTERAAVREKTLTGFYTQEHELVLFVKVS